ncbi:uncharacterized protein METZ01_LOCUS367356 [marine metagenome]|uniref:Uncharacterized protein n=1 Tax=marine metagenome TaxID=408172 RepID=A0A382SY71_9ZZZZ|tara:strand:- start:3182 stop:3670 length:489 start_codon:yes stop_codon:yes gene_type:complete
MKTHCSIANILTLNLANMDNHPKSYLIGILEVILPFFNEFANLFNIVFFLPVLKFDLYPHCDTKLKLFFDIISLTGICLNVAVKTERTKSYMSGLFKGLMYLIFAFVIPNLYMGNVLSQFGKHPYMKLAGGFLVIYFLEICIHSFVCMYDLNIEKNKNRNHL